LEHSIVPIGGGGAHVISPSSYDRQQGTIVDTRLFSPRVQLATSTSGFYRWAKFGRNLGCCCFFCFFFNLVVLVFVFLCDILSVCITACTFVTYLLNKNHQHLCRVLSPFRNARDAPRNNHMKTWQHPQNRKYIMYRNAARRGPNHGHGQHA